MSETPPPPDFAESPPITGRGQREERDEGSDMNRPRRFSFDQDTKRLEPQRVHAVFL